MVQQENPRAVDQPPRACALAPRPASATARQGWPATALAPIAARVAVGALVGAAAPLAAVDATSAGTLSAPHPTFEDVALDWPFAGDDDADGRVAVRLRARRPRPGTTYHVQAISRAAGGGIASSADGTFTTAVPGTTGGTTTAGTSGGTTSGGTSTTSGSASTATGGSRSGHGGCGAGGSFAAIALAIGLASRRGRGGRA